MIGMNALGKNGRLGNQLFQYAGLLGIAKNRGFDHCIPDHSKATTFEYNNRSHSHHLLHCFEMSYLNGRLGIIDGDEVELTQHHFCKELFDECPDNVTLSGYFESFRYFQNAEKELRQDLTFKEHIRSHAEKFHKENGLDNPVSICIRRGDFALYQDCHPMCDELYYKKGIDTLGNDRQYVIVSDDVEWCKNQEIFSGNNFYFVDQVPDGIHKSYNDMCISSMCSDFIISNSTFAWWISWLGINPDKKVCIPVPWFGTKLKDLDTEGYYTENTIKIERKI